MASSPGVTSAHDVAMANSRAYRLAHLHPPLLVDGERFRLGHHQGFHHIAGILDDDHPRQVIPKGSQLGLTVCMVLREVMRAASQPLRGIIYCFPTDDDVSEFSQARFTRVLKDNPALRALIRDTNSIRIKRVGDTFIYFRHVGEQGRRQLSQARLKSTPADALVLDERDEMHPERVEAIVHRLDASMDPHRTDLSTPTVPDYGVDADWQESDQHVWMRRCGRCSAWSCRDDEWPNCLVLDHTGKAPYYRCSKCSRPFESDTGEWVPRFPDKDAIRGYWISQLNSPRRSAEAIALEYEEHERKGKLREFHRQVLGRPYAEIEDMLTRELILAACDRDTPRQLRSRGPTALGVDPGAKVFHWWVAERWSEVDARTLAWGVCRTEDELSDIAHRYGVQVGVIDLGAEKRTVRRLMERHPEFWGCLYQRQKATGYHWNGTDRVISCDRTESLDASHGDLTQRRHRLPRATDDFEAQVIPQLCNLARVVTIDDTTGEQRAQWVVRGGVKNDHYRHAYNLCVIALARVGVAERVARARRAQGRGRRRGRRPRGFMAR